MLAACGGGSTPKAEFQLGDPNPGLSSAQLAAFERGREVFDRRFTKADGHGPDFNTDSCRSCHEFPASGGSSPMYRNFFLVAYAGGANGMTPAFEDGQLVARNFSYERLMREAIPADADIVAQRNAPPMFGMGLLMDVPVADVLVHQDPVDDDGDGVSGRVNLDGPLLGRLGYKAQAGRLENFIRGPIFNHMGITSNPLSFGPNAAVAQVGAPEEPTTDDDGVPDPELSFQDLSDLLVFVEELGPPPPLPMDDTAMQGEELFDTVGCAVCHVPNLVRDGEPVFAYTDLLIHDMGPELADGVIQAGATGSEFRTQPLWGLRHTAPFLHDGRAATIDEAIRKHGGEGSGARDRYVNDLSQAERDAIVAFLETR
jgi:CxxC motif-containing protein (DUF1111 family)